MNIDWTHVAFSDDSKHKDGRYNSLCLVSLSRNKHEELNSEVKDLLIRSDVKTIVDAILKMSTKLNQNLVFQRQILEKKPEKKKEDIPIKMANQ